MSEDADQMDGGGEVAHLVPAWTAATTGATRREAAKVLREQRRQEEAEALFDRPLLSSPGAAAARTRWAQATFRRLGSAPL